MPRLYYCNTIYKVDPPSDINPLILQKYKNKHILVLCAKEAQVIRINILIKNRDYVDYITHYGWWDIENNELVNDYGIIKTFELERYDAVVILDKRRIDPMFYKYLGQVEARCLLPPQVA